ncbi:MAG: hypothetical protein HQK69_10575 [Desulfamplus sp.]|nr:hypothetical protein [Desulfamplus sp.]
MQFEIIGQITNIEIIAVENSINDLERLNKLYGKGRWRKLKGVAVVKRDDYTGKAELHWYEAHGIGKRGFKIKKYL